MYAALASAPIDPQNIKKVLDELANVLFPDKRENDRVRRQKTLEVLQSYAGKEFQFRGTPESMAVKMVNTKWA